MSVIYRGSIKTCSADSLFCTDNADTPINNSFGFKAHTELIDSATIVEKVLSQIRKPFFYCQTPVGVEAPRACLKIVPRKGLISREISPATSIFPLPGLFGFLEFLIALDSIRFLWSFIDSDTKGNIFASGEPGVVLYV